MRLQGGEVKGMGKQGQCEETRYCIGFIYNFSRLQCGTYVT